MAPSNPIIGDLAKKEAKEVLQDFFKGVGYDIDEYSEVRRLQEDLRWVAQRRERETNSGMSRAKTFWAVLTAVIGALIAFTGQWVKDYFLNRPHQ